MCVIIYAEKERPHPVMLEQAWRHNDDGAGIAWRELNAAGLPEVHWSKGHMDMKAILDLCETTPLPYVVHFRRATVGAKKSYLTQPFEASEKSSSGLSGHSKDGVLFHNGTWEEWAAFGREAALRADIKIPRGKWNDSRCLAWLTGIYGEGFMELLPKQRGFHFGPTDHTIYWGDGWVRMKDKNSNEFLCSNDRPWTQNKNYYDNFRGHHADNICQEQNCFMRVSLDKDSRCRNHPLKKQDKQDSGGSPAKDPFPPKALTGKVNLMTLEKAERLRTTKGKDGKRLMSKGTYRAIKSLYKKIHKGGPSGTDALDALARMSQSLL